MEIPAAFEFSVHPDWRRFGSGSCVGGGAEAAYRVKPEIQLLLAVSGCKLLGLAPNTSGDALIYRIGSRWTPLPAGKWTLAPGPLVIQ